MTKHVLTLIGMLTVMSIHSVDAALDLTGSTHHVHRFREWANNFNVELPLDTSANFGRMFENWFSNDKHIENINSQNLTYTLGHNAYSGYSSKEFAELMGFGSNRKILDNYDEKISQMRFLRGSQIGSIQSLESLPVSVDWRIKDAVTGVKDQGQCGSCWSFSTTGALEGAYAIKYNTLKSFSEQQLVDCDNGLRLNHGCNGGLMDSAFDWIGTNGGLCLESDYPYTSGTTQTAGSCKKTCSVDPNSTVKSYVDVTPSSDNAMMSALALQPVAIAIEADQSSFQLYRSGVFTGSCGTSLDHGVLLVGYGTSSGTDYYIMKNSWGTTWGENGYMRMGRGSQYNNGDGQCGLLMQGSYPVV